MMLPCCAFISAPMNAGDYVFSAGGLDNVITMVRVLSDELVFMLCFVLCLLM